MQYKIPNTNYELNLVFSYSDGPEKTGPQNCIISSLKKIGEKYKQLEVKKHNFLSLVYNNFLNCQ